MLGRVFRSTADASSAHLAKLIWADAKRFSINGVNFLATADRADYEIASTPEQFLLLKDRYAIESELGLLKGRAVRNILDVGIWQGGSVTLFDQFFEPECIVGIDFKRDRVGALDDYITKRAKAKRIDVVYNINQADTRRVTDIITKNFPDGLDLIIDDASHFYEESRTTFCAAFPHLVPGGLYIVEDWNWAHRPQNKLWNEPYFRGKLALTNLLIEATIACASASSIVKEVRATPFMFVVERGSADLPRQPLDLGALTHSREHPFAPSL